MKRLLSLAGMLTAAFSASVMQGAENPSFSFEVSNLSAYTWRGLALSTGSVLQSSSTITYRDAHFNAFTNQDLSRALGRRGVLNELDFDLGYDYSREGSVTLSGGLIRYTFPNTSAKSTTELYAGAALARPLHPSVKAYFDVGTVRGTYTSFDLYHSMTLKRMSTRSSWDVVLSAGAGLGSANHNAAYYGVKRTALADLHPTLAFPATFRKIRITPRLGYGMMLDPALRQGPAPKVHGFYAGISLGLML